VSQANPFASLLGSLERPQLNIPICVATLPSAHSHAISAHPFPSSAHLRRSASPSPGKTRSCCDRGACRCSPSDSFAGLQLAARAIPVHGRRALLPPGRPASEETPRLNVTASALAGVSRRVGGAYRTGGGEGGLGACSGSLSTGPGPTIGAQGGPSRLARRRAAAARARRRKQPPAPHAPPPRGRSAYWRTSKSSLGKLRCFADATTSSPARSKSSSMYSWERVRLLSSLSTTKPSLQMFSFTWGGCVGGWVGGWGGVGWGGVGWGVRRAGPGSPGWQTRHARRRGRGDAWPRDAGVHGSPPPLPTHHDEAVALDARLAALKQRQRVRCEAERGAARGARARRRGSNGAWLRCVSLADLLLHPDAAGVRAC
jgi:hypothetical protein